MGATPAKGATTKHDPLITIREVRLSLTEWLDAARKLPDPGSQPRGSIQKIAAQIQSVNSALQAAPPELSGTDEWKREIAAYKEILRELRARLGNFEMALRIRHHQMRDARANLGAARSWSDLAKHIG
jgi:hypothetical protein